MFTTGYGGWPAGGVQEPGQAGDAHERAEQLLAVLGPVVGVGHAASGGSPGRARGRFATPPTTWSPLPAVTSGPTPARWPSPGRTRRCRRVSRALRRSCRTGHASPTRRRPGHPRWRSPTPPTPSCRTRSARSGRPSRGCPGGGRDATSTGVAPGPRWPAAAPTAASARAASVPSAGAAPAPPAACTSVGAGLTGLGRLPEPAPLTAGSPPAATATPRQPPTPRRRRATAMVHAQYEPVGRAGRRRASPHASCGDVPRARRPATPSQSNIPPVTAPFAPATRIASSAPSHAPSARRCTRRQASGDEGELEPGRPARGPTGPPSPPPPRRTGRTIANGGTGRPSAAATSTSATVGDTLIDSVGSGASDERTSRRETSRDAHGRSPSAISRVRLLHVAPDIVGQPARLRGRQLAEPQLGDGGAGRRLSRQRIAMRALDDDRQVVAVAQPSVPALLPAGQRPTVVERRSATSPNSNTSPTARWSGSCQPRSAFAHSWCAHPDATSGPATSSPPTPAAPHPVGGGGSCSGGNSITQPAA